MGWGWYHWDINEESESSRGSRQLKCPSATQDVKLQQLVFKVCVCVSLVPSNKHTHEYHSCLNTEDPPEVEEVSDPQHQKCSEEAEMTQIIDPKERERERAHVSQRQGVRQKQ